MTSIEHDRIAVGQLGVIARELRMILAELAQNEQWQGAGFYRMQQQGAYIDRVPASVADVKLLGANQFRRQAVIFNESTAVLYVAYALQATLTNYTFQIAAGGSLVIDKYVGPLHGVWAAANGSAQVTEA